MEEVYDLKIIGFENYEKQISLTPEQLVGVQKFISVLGELDFNDSPDVTILKDGNVIL